MKLTVLKWLPVWPFTKLCAIIVRTDIVLWSDAFGPVWNFFMFHHLNVCLWSSCISGVCMVLLYTIPLPYWLVYFNVSSMDASKQVRYVLPKFWKIKGFSLQFRHSDSFVIPDWILDKHEIPFLKILRKCWRFIKISSDSSVLHAS